jgi:hypothetical protein
MIEMIFVMEIKREDFQKKVKPALRNSPRSSEFIVFIVPKPYRRIFNPGNFTRTECAGVGSEILKRSLFVAAFFRGN